MAVSTYAELKTAIASALKRSDLTSDIPNFIALAEAEINRRLALSPVRPQRAYTTITIDAEFVSAPADLLKPISLYVSEDRELSYVDPESIARLSLEGQLDDWLSGMIDSSGEPRWFTVIDDEIQFIPAPTGSETGRLTYYKKLPALSDSATTNWLLTAHPDVYYYATLAHGEQFVWNQSEADRLSAFADGLLDKVLSSYPEQGDRAPLRSDLPRGNDFLGWFRR